MSARWAPPWISSFVNADVKAKGSLIRTLRMLADTDLNVQEAGRQLGVHPNTVYSRIGRIMELSGLDGQRHHDLVELLLAADAGSLDLTPKLVMSVPGLGCVKNALADALKYRDLSDLAELDHFA